MQDDTCQACVAHLHAWGNKKGMIIRPVACECVFTALFPYTQTMHVACVTALTQNQ